jgi:nitrile hydratase accessory protein
MIGPGLPGHAGTPSFVEPWHAQAFAAVVALNQAGRFTWAEWVEIFSAEIAREPQRDGEESEAAYYRQWLAAFERLPADRSLVLAEEITATADDWRRTYLHTPHGKPVYLRRDLPDIPTTVQHSHHDRHHERRHSATPAAVHPGSPSVVA